MILNLSNFIHSLLLENETVIIPGFGAFISKYKPAEIRGKEIIPPSKEISFTTQIKNNDGLLVEIIARKAKISQPNATKRIEKARENILYQLDSGEAVILENIGTLTYDENNEIKFVPVYDENMLIESFGFEKVTTEDFVEKKKSAPVEEIQVERQIPVAESELQNKTGNNESTIVIPQVSAEKELVASAQPENEPRVKSESEAGKSPETIKLPYFHTAENDELQDERKKVRWYWVLLILIPIFIAGYFVWNKKSGSNRNEIIQNPETGYVQQAPEVQQEVAVDSVQNDSVQIPESEPKVNVATEPEMKQDSGKYYLVGGSFENPENVDKFILQLKEKGMNGYPIGKKGRLNLVAIGIFDTHEEAQDSLNAFVKADPNWQIWIYKK